MCTKKDTSPGELKQYYAITLDPLHVGAGSSRLGRVDLPIIREPGTNLPKVPGTSLSGPARAYTALPTIAMYGKMAKWNIGVPAAAELAGKSTAAKLILHVLFASLMAFPRVLEAACRD